MLKRDRDYETQRDETMEFQEVVKFSDLVFKSVSRLVIARRSVGRGASGFRCPAGPEYDDFGEWNARTMVKVLWG
jgi:hypothetical protein